MTQCPFRQSIENKSIRLIGREHGENPGGMKNKGKSHDVVENTCRKNVTLDLSHDVYENKGTYLIEATMFVKTKAVIGLRGLVFALDCPLGAFGPRNRMEVSLYPFVIPRSSSWRVREPR